MEPITTPSWINWTLGILICYSFFTTILSFVLIKKLIPPLPKPRTIVSPPIQPVIPLTLVAPDRPLPFSSFSKPVPKPRLRSFPIPSPDPRHLSPDTTFQSPKPSLRFIPTPSPDLCHLSPSTTFHSPINRSPGTSSFASFSSSLSLPPPTSAFYEE